MGKSASGTKTAAKPAAKRRPARQPRLEITEADLKLLGAEVQRRLQAIARGDSACIELSQGAVIHAQRSFGGALEAGVCPAGSKKAPGEILHVGHPDREDEFLLSSFTSFIRHAAEVNGEAQLNG